MNRWITRIGIAGTTLLAATTAGITFEATATATSTYSVVGTGGDGLKVRQTPSTSLPALGRLDDGTPITVVCQVRGKSVQTPDGPDAIWDKVAGSMSGYVSDRWVSTQVFADFSPGLPECSEAVQGMDLQGGGPGQLPGGTSIDIPENAADGCGQVPNDTMTPAKDGLAALTEDADAGYADLGICGALRWVVDQAAGSAANTILPVNCIAAVVRDDGAGDIIRNCQGPLRKRLKR